MIEGIEPVVEKSAPPSAAPVSSPQPKKKSKALLIIVALVVIAIVVALAAKFMPNASKQSAKASTDPTSIVANVNGIDITRGELDKKIAQVKSTVPEGSADPSADAAFELQLLDEVVNLKLLVSTAQARNFTVADADIQTEIDALVTKFGSQEEFQKQLTANGLTADELKENMRNELLIRQLIDSETDIKNVVVTDAEIKTTYDQAIAGADKGTDTPPLAEVSEMIKAQLLQQKSATIVQEYINKLRAGAKINILL
jgi:hypothetical protein